MKPFVCVHYQKVYILDAVNMLIFYNAVTGQTYKTTYKKKRSLLINANKITLCTVHRVGCDWKFTLAAHFRSMCGCVLLPITYGNCHSLVGFFSTPHKRVGNFSPKYLRNFHLIWYHLGIRITLDHCLPRFSPPPLFVLPLCCICSYTSVFLMRQISLF